MPGARRVFPLLLLATVFLLAVGVVTAVARSGGGAAEYRGVYVAGPMLKGPADLLPDQVYARPEASGVFIRIPWERIEPQRGRFDFGLLDREIDRALAARKRISIAVIAGDGSPGWLSAAGVRTVRLGVRRGGPLSTDCRTAVFPVPWDPGFQAAFLGMMDALAKHLRGRSGAWDALSIVKLTGVNRDSAEMWLPSGLGENDRACDAREKTDVWVAEGFRPKLMVDTFVTLAEGIAGRFPGKLLALPILEGNDFPPIDDQGARVRRSSVKARIIAELERRLGPRFAVQWNALTASGDRLPATVLEAQRRGTAIGWQTNLFQGPRAGASCGDDRRDRQQAACDAPGYGAIMRKGVETGASFLEIWPEDLLRFREAVGAADAALKRNGAGPR